MTNEPKTYPIGKKLYYVYAGKVCSFTVGDGTETSAWYKRCLETGEEIYETEEEARRSVETKPEKSANEPRSIEEELADLPLACDEFGDHLPRATKEVAAYVRAKLAEFRDEVKSKSYLIDGREQDNVVYVEDIDAAYNRITGEAE